MLKGGRFFITAGVQALGEEFVMQAIAIMRTYDNFTPDNDPHCEHDFGNFTCSGKKLFWKIDYYDQDLKFCSSDPSDISVTIRVLTLMLHEEY